MPKLTESRIIMRDDLESAGSRREMIMGLGTPPPTIWGYRDLSGVQHVPGTSLGPNGSIVTPFTQNDHSQFVGK